jgi:hypothetical protein
MSRDPRVLTGLAAAIGLLMVSLRAWQIARSHRPAGGAVVSDAVMSHAAPVVLDKPVVDSQPPRNPTTLPQEVIATAAPSAPAPDVTTQPSPASETSTASALTSPPSPAPAVVTDSALNFQLMYFSNDLDVGFPDPFGAMLNESTQPPSTEPAGLNATASILDDELLPAMAMPAGFNSEPAR